MACSVSDTPALKDLPKVATDLKSQLEAFNTSCLRDVDTNEKIVLPSAEGMCNYIYSLVYCTKTDWPRRKTYKYQYGYGSYVTVTLNEKRVISITKKTLLVYKMKGIDEARERVGRELIYLLQICKVETSIGLPGVSSQYID